MYETVAGGRWERYTTTLNSLTFTATVTPQEITVAGFPTLFFRYRPDGRLRDITANNREIISYGYGRNATTGDVTQVRLASEYTLQFKSLPGGETQQTLKGRGGHLLRDQVTPGSVAARPLMPLELDVVADGVGLPSDWARLHNGQWNSTGSVAAIRHGDGPFYAYAWRFGDLWMVCDLSGAPLFLQVDLEHLVLPWVGSGVPTRLTLKPDGAVGVHTDIPLIRGVQGFWTKHSAAGTAMEYRHVGTPPTSVGKGSIVPNLAYECTSTQVCTTYDGVESCGAWITTCDYVSSGTTYTPYVPGDGDTYEGGGSTGTTSSNNKITNDLTLRARVNTAVDKAKEKLQRSSCADVLTKFIAIGGPSTGKTLDAELVRLRTDAPTYIRTYVEYRNGTNYSSCSPSGTFAFVSPPGSRPVYVCKRFSDFVYSQPSQAANRMIHEMMHTLGLGENPPTAGQPTDAEINGAIDKACGS